MKLILSLFVLLLIPSSSKAVWQGKLDLADPTAYGPFVGREIIDGQYKAGAVYEPYGIYRDDVRWFHAGINLLTNAEKLNASFGPVVGVDIIKWTSQPQLTGIAEKGASFYKPLGLSSCALTLDFFGGWTPIHTKDVHDWAAGFGLKLVAHAGQSATDQSNQILKQGL